MKGRRGGKVGNLKVSSASTPKFLLALKAKHGLLQPQEEYQKNPLYMGDSVENQLRRDKARANRRLPQERPDFDDERPVVVNADEYSKSELDGSLVEVDASSATSSSAAAARKNGRSISSSSAKSRRAESVEADALERETGKHVFRPKKKKKKLVVDESRKSKDSLSSAGGKKKKSKKKKAKANTSMLSFDVED